MGLLQPAGLGQVGDLQGLQHLGQSVDHTVGAIGVELPEGKAPFPLIKDPSRVPALRRSCTVWRLPAARSSFTSAVPIVEARSWWRRAKLRRSASNSSWAALAGGGSQPIGERAVCLGAGGAFPRGHRGQRLQQCCLGWWIERRTAKLIENSGPKLRLWGHELRQEPCSAQPQTVRDVRASCHAAGQSDGCCFTCGQDQVSEDVGVEQLDHTAFSS